MTLTITDQLISSGYAVRPAPGRPHAWELSWPSSQLLGRHTAITAMMLAYTASDARRDEGYRLWPTIHNWAAAQASQPLDQIKGSDQGIARPGHCRIVSDRDQWAVPAGSVWSFP